MDEPIWIDCGSPGEVAAPTQLAALTSSGRHVVLRFASLSEADKTALIGHLSSALPDHSVFDSGGNGDRSWVTIMPVVTRARVVECRGQVLQATEEYRQACIGLVEQYRTGTLPSEWRTDEHGGHCRFESRLTGQVVEAPLREWIDPERVDPYFFAMFVRSTSGLESVAKLLTHDFHDAARVLDVIAGRAEQDA